ncbi:HxlR family transcriptional regulator [Kineosporia sp. NBRC 101677]|uniref:winged helix-turn-helix transcriptional regulator n=1 Tax=Kineosporia sp. NBRC 101677 TaxID=3032197 RepID=UPI0024A1B683|nr:helix-turn-helix domain-containing protein [Kineosporia sp. NBRC 101677]GLY19709.1 HxlR family transcriptional regulator [Kineosporia sp. NBRC 101677]
MADTEAVRVQNCGILLADKEAFVREILDRVGDRWSLLVLGHLREKPHRYSGLVKVVPGISQRMLTVTLKQLTDDGLLRRQAYAELPPRVEYSLTPLGESFLDTASAFVRWTVLHHDEIQANRQRDV